MTEAGQAPNAKARFHKLDPQSESIALDHLCYAFELPREDTKSLAVFIDTLKSKLPPTNGHADTGATLEVVFLKEELAKAKAEARRNVSVFSRIFCDEVPNELLEAPSVEPILRQVLRVGSLLLRKNKSYGDSALKPLRVFSKADPVEQLRVRLDDKLSRLARGQMDGEDALLDLVGYYILLKVAEEEHRGR